MGISHRAALTRSKRGACVSSYIISFCKPGMGEGQRGQFAGEGAAVSSEQQLKNGCTSQVRGRRRGAHSTYALSKTWKEGVLTSPFLAYPWQLSMLHIRLVLLKLWQFTKMMYHYDEITNLTLSLNGFTNLFFL